MYHLYVDEVGHTTHGASNRPDHRYLSLTGVIIEEAGLSDLQARFDAFRSECVGHTPEVPIVLHRAAIGGQKGLGKILRDRDNRPQFEEGFVNLLADADLTVITVGIDKISFYHKYETWTGDPYEFCAFNLIERYCLFLHYKGGRGTVTVETRNPNADEQFRAAFAKLCADGTRFMPAARVNHLIGHAPVKVAKKNDDIMGVQLADFLCQPMLEACLKKYRNRGSTTDFHKRLMRAAWPKLYRSKFGRIRGAGLVWRP